MPTWLTLKASLYAGIALLLLLGAQTVRLHIAHADLSVAKADLKTRTVERDAAATNAQDQARASESWKTVASERGRLLDEAQAENLRLAEDNRTAAAAAAAKQRAAAADLTAWRRKYDSLLHSDSCARAQQALEAACPVDSY